MANYQNTTEQMKQNESKEFSGIQLGRVNILNLFKSFSPKSMISGVSGATKNGAAIGAKVSNTVNKGIMSGQYIPEAPNLVNKTDFSKMGINIDEKLKENNIKMIENKFSHIEGLTPELLDRNKVYLKDNRLWNNLTSEKLATQLEYQGIFNKPLHPSAKGEPAAMMVGWGDAFKKAAMDPKMLAGAVEALSSVKGLEKIGEYAQKGLPFLEKLEGNPDDVEGDAAFIDYQKYIEDGYKNYLSDYEGLLGMYKYYKIRSETAPIGEGLGTELSDAFFGDISFNVGSFIDGAADAATEFWQEKSLQAWDMVNSGFDQFNNFSKTLYEATGVKMQLNPAIQEKIYGTMEKLGFGKPGMGTDTRAKLQSTLILHTEITFLEEKVTLLTESLVTLFDKHDFLNSKSTERMMTLNLSNQQIDKLKLTEENKKYKIQIKRTYGHSPGQLPTTGADKYNFNAEFYPFETLENCVAVRAGKTSGKSTKEVKKNTQKINSAKNDDKSTITYEKISFSIMDETVTSIQTNNKINGIPKYTTFEQLIAWAASYCLTENVKIYLPPIDESKKDVQISGIPISPPMGFYDLVYWLQDQHKLWGQKGVNIYTEQNRVYIIPKSGRFDNIEGEYSWTYELTVASNKNYNKDEFCIIIPSRKKIKYVIGMDDITIPADLTDYSEVTTSAAPTNKMGVTTSAKSEVSSKTETKQHNYAMTIPESNPTNKVINVRLPYCFFSVEPGDVIKLYWNNKKYVGSVRRWVSQQQGVFRMVAIQLIVDEQEQTHEDKWTKNSPGNLIENLQEKAQLARAKSEKWLWDKADVFGKKTDELFKRVSNKEGNGFFNLLQQYIPDIQMPMPTHDNITNPNYTLGQQKVAMGNSLPEIPDWGNLSGREQVQKMTSAYGYDEFLRKKKEVTDDVYNKIPQPTNPVNNSVTIPKGARF